MFKNLKNMRTIFPNVFELIDYINKIPGLFSIMKSVPDNMSNMSTGYPQIKNYCVFIGYIEKGILKTIKCYLKLKSGTLNPEAIEFLKNWKNKHRRRKKKTSRFNLIDI